MNGVCVRCAKAMAGCVESWCGLLILLVEFGSFVRLITASYGLVYECDSVVLGSSE